jgi:hypothetical protein
VDVSSKKCEGCQLKSSSFGLSAEGKKRWCGGCAKGHAGTEDLSNKKRKKCEGCQLKKPSFGLPAEGKARWCSGCAKAHAGAVSVTNKCEGCGLKSSSFGLPGDEKKLRWCAGCAKAHAGAVDRRGCGPKEKKQKATDPPLTVSEH